MGHRGGQWPVHAAVTVVAVLGLAAVMLTPVGRVEAQGTRLFLSPVAATIPLGETVQVSIRIENVADLRSLELRLGYDQRVLDVVDADPASPGIQIAPGGLLGSGAVGTNTAYPGIGEIVFSQTAIGPAVTGSGTVAVITFRGVATGTSPVSFASAALYDPDQNPIAVTAEDGEITVLRAGAPTPTPTPTETPSPIAPPEPTWTPTPAPPEPSPTPYLDRTPATFATPRPGQRDLRRVQLWPDRMAGAVSGQALFAPAIRSARAGPLLPFGAVDAGEDQPVRAQTYLRFPLERLPPGTDILKATLYVFVDGATRAGAAQFGLYRVLEDWQAAEIAPNPALWPRLLDAPIALAQLEIGAVTATLPAPTQPPTAPSAPGETPAPQANATPTAPISPLPTPTGEPLRASSQPVTLSQMAETWLAWDITALARAWWAGQVPNFGLALGPAPSPGADAQSAGNVLLARAFAEALPEWQPYLVLEIEVLPVTPTPTIALLLPAAGGGGGWMVVGLLLAGTAVFLAGVALRRRRRAAG